jgi:hypothetical protein
MPAIVLATLNARFAHRALTRDRHVSARVELVSILARAEARALTDMRSGVVAAG